MDKTIRKAFADWLRTPVEINDRKQRESLADLLDPKPDESFCAVADLRDPIPAFMPAPEGFEFTGDCRRVGWDDDYMDSRDNAAHHWQSVTLSKKRYNILRKLPVAPVFKNGDVVAYKGGDVRIITSLGCVAMDNQVEHMVSHSEFHPASDEEIVQYQDAMSNFHMPLPKLVREYAKLKYGDKNDE